MRHVRVVLADDHPMVLEGLKRLLQGNWDIVGTVEDGRRLVAMVQRLKPDIAVIDISMPGLNGLDAGRQIKQLVPTCQLVFLTMHADPTYAAEAFEAGGSAFLIKRSAASELETALNEVIQGRRYLTPLIAIEEISPVRLPAHITARLGKELTLRQKEVLQLLAEGHTIKEIAALLHISVKTVEFHKTRIKDLLGLKSVADLTRYAVAQGLIPSNHLPKHDPESKR